MRRCSPIRRSIRRVKLGMNVLADIGDFGYYTNTSNIVTRT